MMNPLLGLGGLGLISGKRVKAESFYKGVTLGSAYKVNNTLSLSLGVRYIDAHREAKVSTTLTNLSGTKTENAAYEENADGWGGIIGFDISPTGPVNIGIRYETRVALDFKQSVRQDSLGLIPLIGSAFGVTDGGVVSRDLPAILGLGVSYQVTPQIRVENNLTWYFNEDVDWQGKEYKVDDGYEIGAMMEYKFNKKWLASIGYLYSHTGMDPENTTPESPALDVNTIGTSLAYKPIRKLTLNFAVGNAFYMSDSLFTLRLRGLPTKSNTKKIIFSSDSVLNINLFNRRRPDEGPDQSYCPSPGGPTGSGEGGGDPRLLEIRYRINGGQREPGENHWETGANGPCYPYDFKRCFGQSS